MWKLAGRFQRFAASLAECRGVQRRGVARFEHAGHVEALEEGAHIVIGRLLD